MKNTRQYELVNSFLSEAGTALTPLYREIINCLSGLGYYPKKDKSYLSFKHDLHNKQIAKMGMRRGKTPLPFFALRFSACKGYSQRFSDIVGAAIDKYPHKSPACINNGCSFCKGEPYTHVYEYTFPDGERRFHCGAYALEIPNITAGDADEIKKLICQEHQYLLAHETCGNT